MYFKSYTHALLGALLGCSVTANLLASESLDLSLPSEKNNVILTQSILSLDAALQLAEQGNPGLQEMQARADAMAAIPSQVGSLPDPLLSFGLANLPVDSFDTSQEAMTQWQFGISQALPYPGKLALQEQAAAQLADAASYTSEEFRQRLLSDVKTLWWRLFYLDKTLGIVAINKTLLRQFIDIAQTKYQVGQGLQQDVLLAQLELSKLIDRELQLNSTRQQEQARLNTLLNRQPDEAISLPDSDTVDTQLLALKPLQQLLHLAEEKRPLLAEARQQVAAAATQKALAERNLLPDFKLSAAYGLRQGNNMDGSDRSDFMSVQLGIQLPLFADRKQKMAISQKNSELKQQQFALQDQWAQVRSEISRNLTAYQQASQQQQLLQTGIIPQARQTVASMLAGYQVNKVDFLNLIRSQITLYNYETTLWQVIAEAKTKEAELQASVGEDAIHE